LDREFRELNAAQLQTNARLAVEQLTEQRGGVTKEKVAALGRRMMRAEGEMGEGSWLPPIAVLLSAAQISLDFVTVPPRDVLTPLMESTPVEGRDKGKMDYWSHNLKL